VLTAGREENIEDKPMIVKELNIVENCV